MIFNILFLNLQKELPKCLGEINNMNIVIRIIVGAFSGWLAGQVIRGYDLGLFRNIIVGLLGAFFGGWLFQQLRIIPPGGLLGEGIVAFCGAAVLLILVRVLARIFN